MEPLQERFYDFPISQKLISIVQTFLPRFQRSKPYHHKLFHRIHPSSLLSDRRPSRLECTARRCYTETHCLDKKSWALLKISFSVEWKRTKKWMCKQKNLIHNGLGLRGEQMDGSEGKKFHSRTSIGFTRWKERLTAVARVFVRSVAAILLLVALPSLRYTASIVASELILAARVFCNKNKRKAKLKTLIAAEG